MDGVYVILALGIISDAVALLFNNAAVDLGLHDTYYVVAHF